MTTCLHRSALALLWVTLAAPMPARVPPTDWVALVGAYPGAGSEAERGDTAILLWLQRTRTHEDSLRVQGEVVPRAGLFSGAAGADLDSGRFPLTLALIVAAGNDLHEPMTGVKRHFARPRPYVEDPRIKPAVPMESSYAYPSFHAGWGVLVAAILADLAPSRREMLIERGRQMGNDRVVAGVHHPSDVVAGQRLGEALAAAWLQTPERRRQLEAARAAEWVNPNAPSR